MLGNFLRGHSKNPALISTLFFFLFILFGSTSFSQTFGWEHKIDSRARKIGADFEFVALHDLAEILNTKTYFSNKARKAILYLPDEKITVTAFSPFVILGERVLQMPISCEYKDGDIWVPVRFFVPILKEVKNLTNAQFASNGTDVDLPASNANLFGVQIDEKANGTLIRVLTGKTFDKSNISTRYSRNWLYLDVLNGRIDTKTFQIRLEKGLVKKIVPLQLDQLAQVSFQLSRDISDLKLELTQRPNEIWISIPANDRLSPDFIEKLNADKEKWRIDKIIIDPGHGGKDPGAIGPSGVKEKDVVLAIAKKLRDLLKKKLDATVVMTRDSDVFVPLTERTKFANREQGKLFLSIHANANRNRHVNGLTTYFLGQARSEEALEIAQLENSVIKYETDKGAYSRLTDESFILASMAQNDYNKESQDFAAMVQDEVSDLMDMKDRGVKQAGFYVLVGASMPNILIETAFISNRNEERMLNSSRQQSKIAEAIFRSVKKFKEKYEWVFN